MKNSRASKLWSTFFQRKNLSIVARQVECGQLTDPQGCPQASACGQVSYPYGRGTTAVVSRLFGSSGLLVRAFCGTNKAERPRLFGAVAGGAAS